MPILIHGGRGLPPITTDLMRLLEEYPNTQLIIAHAGIADMAGLAAAFAGKTGVFFDTSVWSPVDLLDFFHRIPPEQVVFGTDYPYGQQPSALLLLVRIARVAGLSEVDVRNILTHNGERIASGQQPLAPTAPRGARVFRQIPAFFRIYQYIAMAIPLFWTNQFDTIGVLDLALNATHDDDDRHFDELRKLRALLTSAREVWRAAATADDEAARYRYDRLLSRLLSLAATVAVTSGLEPAPELANTR